MALCRLAEMGGSSPVYGVVVGIVTNHKDPDDLGRVKLKFPWLSDSYESDWARITQLGAGPNAGAVFIPEVNDEVLVAFEHGDIRHPYVVGSLYNGKDKPALGSSLFNQGKVKRNGFVSRKGHKLIFFEDQGKAGIALITSDAKLTISLDESGSEIRIKSQGKVTIESQGDMKLKSGGGVSVQAGGSLELKGSTVKVTGDSSVQIKGQPIQLN